MRVLLVEDNIGVAEDLERALTRHGDCEVIWAKSRNSARRHLVDNSFDLLILDRNIPTDDDALDGDAAHGWAIFQEVCQNCSGLPVWFLTATEDADFAANVANDYARQGDIHGIREQQAVVRVIWKKNLNDVVANARTFIDQVRQLETISILNASGVNLTSYEEKNLRIFGRRHLATSLEIIGLSGGLSGARVLKVSVKNSAGAVRLTSVAKIGKSAAVEDEVMRYNANVVRLHPDGFPQLSALVDVGSGKIYGVYYGLVSENVQSTLSILKANPSSAGYIPAELRRISASWERETRQETVTVGEIRRRLLPDTKRDQVIQQLQGIDLTSVEAVRVTANRSTQHNDLHGENALIYDDRKVMVIDFNDVGESFAGLDAVTLSLSTIFHRDSANLRSGWMNPSKIENWTDLASYIDGCAFADFIAECRRWANDVAGSPKTTSALAYAYALRQLKYSDTDKDLARALLRATIKDILN
ncbi:proteobacterial dedicated sortase system response regulator [Agrobacterium sp. DSM 25558]|uniref:response regulator n=1 Tax=Agrobacterium sp. DSM 25558 TaxID=1907665 RepID=UPI0009725902|nr:response regulator [Agrobacterium sp. DSM 25558]SCX28051.1 proteobacterial dedicated sortase system response regulator [Agrobacterium sp. DSM 25558]